MAIDAMRLYGEEERFARSTFAAWIKHPQTRIVIDRRREAAETVTGRDGR